MKKLTLKFSYAFVVLYSFAILTIGTIAPSLNLLQAMSCIPIFFYIICIVGVTLYLIIATIFITDSRSRLWGSLLFVEAVACSVSIIIAVQYIEDENIYNIQIENTIPESQLRARSIEIEKNKNIRIFISHKKNGVNVRFKRNPDNAINEMLSIYIQKMLCTTDAIAVETK